MKGNAFSSILIFVVFIALMYFMMIRPQKKKEKEDNAMRNALKVGDEIMTIGGVMGKVVKINEKSVVIATGADKNKIEFIKSAIASVNKSDSASNTSAKKAKKEEVVEEKGPEKEKKVSPKKLEKKSDK